MLGESEHPHITGRVAQILKGTNERTYSPVATVLFQLAHLVLSVFSAILPDFVSIYLLLPSPSWSLHHAWSLLRRF